MSGGPSLKEAFRYWLKLGFISFGGPTGQIAIMHKDLVDRKKWIEESHFLQALNFCMLLPGPEAQQLATYIGWHLNGWRGGVIAGALFVLPSIFMLWALSWVYVTLGAVPAVAALFYGLKPAVVAIVLEAVLRIGKKALRSYFLYGFAAAAFVGIFFLNIPFPVIVLSSGVAGYFLFRLKPALIPQGSAQDNTQDDGHGESRTFARFMKVGALFLALWCAPVLAVGFWRGWNDILLDIGVLFSKAAVVTFGGAYAVLGYIGQQAVAHYGWLLPEQMMDGLGLAETTPGPLIMVNQFVAYVAAYTHAKGLAPAVAGAVGGLLTTWVTFVPSTMMIFLLAPYIALLRKNRELGAALTGITAAVVGVVLNLAVVFTRHTLVPDRGGFDWFALAAALIAFAGIQRLKWGMIPVIAGSALAGLLWKFFIV